MSPRNLAPAMRTLRYVPSASRSFQTSSKRMAELLPPPLPVRKPVGAFRGGLFGFLFGTALTGFGVYYYVLDEYKVSNELLTEDIYSLQATVQRVHAHVQGLEEKVEALEKKR